MRKQDSERSAQRRICREKISEGIVMTFLALFAISTLLFHPIRQCVLFAADYYSSFISNQSVAGLLEFVLSDGSFFTVTRKDLMEENTILTKRSNEHLYESGFALNYVRDELPVKTDISDEDTDARLVTSEQFEEFLQSYSKMSFSEFVGSYYIVDSSTAVTESIIDVNQFLVKDCTMKEGEQILIYHTHGSEAFADSDGSMEDSIIGVGSYLAELLEEKGYDVIHDTNYYDRENGVVNRNVAYSQALEGVTKDLEENPNVSVVIDLHRDSGEKRTVTINGKDMCKVMLFNGLSHNADGDIERLPNPNREYNLSFSFQLKLMSDCLYDGYMNKIYLRNYRYNMHVMEKYILAEVGTDQNTVQEAYNSMEIFAEVLDSVLREAE